MQNDLQIFENNDFGKVRVIDIDGQPWFLGKDVTNALGYQNTRKALIDHVDSEDKNTVTIRDGIPGNPNKTIINESGLYSLILSSKLPDAKKFKRWVTSEILPSIRKHGAYIIDEILEEAVRSQDFALELFGKLQAEKGKNAALLDRVEEFAPKARYYDLILQCKGVVQVSIIAKDYGMTAVAFNRLLHDMRIQFKMGNTWLLYKQLADQGFTKTRTYYTPGGNGVIHTYWTQKGRLFLYETLFEAGIVPLMESENPAI